MYLMRTQTDCGPAALAEVTGVDYLKIMAEWPGGFNGNSSDSYIHHQQILSTLGFRWRQVELPELMAGMAPVNRTMVMINSRDNPETLLPENQTVLHWIIYAGLHNNTPSFHWGDGTIRNIPPYEFMKYWKSPFCVAYAVDVGDAGDLPWYKRLWIWLTSFLRW